MALGKIDADTAAKGGIGLESERFVKPWDMMWHWESRLLDVPDWLDLPLNSVAPTKSLSAGLQHNSCPPVRPTESLPVSGQGRTGV